MKHNLPASIHQPRGMRALLIALLLGLLLFALAACEDAPPADEPVVEAAPAQENGASASGDTAASGQAAASLPTATPTPEPLSGRITLWHSWAEGDGDALTAILAAYQQANPGVTVDTLFVAYADLPQAYADAVAGGSGPDLLLAPNWWLGDLVAADTLQPLEDAVTPEERANFWPAALENFVWQGTLYGLPTNYELVTAFVNRALADPAAMPATTDAWLAQAQAAPTSGIGLYNNLYHLYWGLPAYGAQLFDDSGLAVIDETGDAAAYLAWLRAVSETTGSYVDPDYGMLLDRFKKGEFAYFVDGPWAIDELRSALGDNLAVAQLPAGPAGPAQPWLTADGVFINPTVAPEPQTLALDFARFLTGAESGAAIAQVGRRLPANRNAALGDDAILQGFARQAAAAQPMPGLPEMAQAWGYGGDMFVKVVDGDADPAATVRETAALINDANGK
ncbi:MAG: extracellular solute-binding protein [Caldilineaceae bacterium]|nr:extracellular solute-binding protein [Caldilineaceae bacterium]